VVLAAGGAKHTLQATIAAAASGRRVVPLGCFGGAARQAVTIFEAMAGRWGPHIPPHDVLGSLASSWSPRYLELILRTLGARVPRVLIVHGHDLTSRDRLAAHLAALGIPATIMGNTATLGAALREKFEKLAQDVDCAIALVTPDNVGRARDAEVSQQQQGRARQNVWVEVGWFWGTLGRSRVLLRGKGEAEIPSDLSGLLVERFTHDPAERNDGIVQWIEALGWPRPSPAAGP
jgi:Predicted nucleotide-binding protein containing TIR-like domain